jgi:anaerobic selenocysteine-containing dehydrogenase
MASSPIGQVETHYRNCHLCEAVCGLEIKVQNGRIVSVHGDNEDPLSRGYICPKGVAIKDMHDDPDRLRKPVRKTTTGWEEISWDEALDYAADGLADVQKRYGDNAVADFIGNPYGTVYGIMTHIGYFRKALNTRNSASLASIDHISNLMSSALMYGNQFLLPIPDLDRAEFVVMAGANPLASNGSLMTAPGVRDRLKAIKSRGGKLVIIDPRRTESAKLADEHHPIRPGTDAAFAAAILNTLFEENLVNPRALTEFLNDLDEVARVVKPFTAERAAIVTGVEAGAIRQLARDFAAAERAVWYGRIGTCAQEFGAITQWLFSLINIVTGNLDRPGGYMLTTPAVDVTQDPNVDPGRYGEWHTRVRGLPSFGGEIPASSFAEEMLTPGEGQIHAFTCIASNPVLSFPNGRYMDKALESLDFMVSLDPFITATSRHANVILPAVPNVQSDHYELVFYSLAVRNVTKFSQPSIQTTDGGMMDWEILVALGERIAARKGLPIEPTISPAEMIDFALQNGHYGKANGHPAELSLEKLNAAPHGIDLGPLQSRMPDCLQTEDKRIHCAPPELVQDLERLETDLFAKPVTDDLMLIGRRHVRSKNTQTQNCQRLMRGPNLCTLLMHPDDLALRELYDGDVVRVTSKVGEACLPVTSTEDITPGVVSIPHGFDHGREGVRLSVSAQYAAVSVNDLTDDSRVDLVTGMPVFNGVPVTVSSIEPV